MWRGKTTALVVAAGASVILALCIATATSAWVWSALALLLAAAVDRLTLKNFGLQSGAEVLLEDLGISDDSDDEYATYSLAFARQRGSLSSAQVAAVEQLEQHPWAWRVSVHVLEGKNLVAADKSIFRKDSSDPYAEVRVGRGGSWSKAKRTATKTRTLNPNWRLDSHSRMRFDAKEDGSNLDVLCDCVDIQVYDYDSGTKDDLLGHIRLPLWHLVVHGGATGSLLGASETAIIVTNDGNKARFPNFDEADLADMDVKRRMRRWYELENDYDMAAPTCSPRQQQILASISVEPVRKLTPTAQDAVEMTGIAGLQAVAEHMPLQLHVFVKDVVRVINERKVRLDSEWYLQLQLRCPGTRIDERHHTRIRHPHGISAADSVSVDGERLVFAQRLSQQSPYLRTMNLAIKLRARRRSLTNCDSVSNSVPAADTHGRALGGFCSARVVADGMVTVAKTSLPLQPLLCGKKALRAARTTHHIPLKSKVKSAGMTTRPSYPQTQLTPVNTNVDMVVELGIEIKATG